MSGTTPVLTLNTGCEMPVIGLGTFNKFKKGEVKAAVRAALQGGYRHVDTAWVYQSENEVGEALREELAAGTVRREDIFITSKLWNTFHAPDRVEEGLRESMSDLGVDYIDLYLMHWPMASKEAKDKRAWIMNTDFQPDDVDYIDTWRAMEKLVDKGLVKAIGVSNFNISQLKRLLAANGLRYKPANVQIEINPYHANCDLVDFCLQSGITVTAFSPLAKGGAEYAGKPTPNLMQDKVLTDIAARLGKTPAQVALRWGLQRQYALVPKSVTASRIQENLKVFDFELTDDDMASISSLNKDMRLVDLANFKEFPEYPFK